MAEPFVLQGACERQADVNGRTFRQAGNSVSGAPIYKADDRDLYVYYDPDCNGDKEPSLKPMWILNVRVPSTTKSTDLDGDVDTTARADTLHASRKAMEKILSGANKVLCSK